VRSVLSHELEHSRNRNRWQHQTIL